MSRYISFVFHQKSACQVVKPSADEEDDDKENEDDCDKDASYLDEE